MVKIVLACVIVAFASSALAQESDGDVKRGRYWYEKDAEKQEREKVEQSKPESPAKPKYTMPVVPPVAELMKWHPRDLNALFTEVHEYHVMAPTLETGAAVQKLKAVFNKKSRAAAAVEQLAMLQNPTLSGVAENAVTPTARSVQRQEREQAISARIGQERNNFALIILTQPGCGACRIQRNILANFQDTYGWPIKEVNIIDNPEAQARFGVDVTPKTLIASRETGGWQTVAVGADTLSGVTNNVYQAIRLLTGEIKPEQWLTAPNQSNSLYDPSFQ